MEAALRQMLCDRQREVTEMQVKLNVNEERVKHLRNRLQLVMGRGVDHLSLPELQDLEDTLGQALERIRQVKKDKIEAQRRSNSTDRHESLLCVVCLSSDKSVLCLPCRHLCLCLSCSEHAQMTRCPICREFIDEKISVFA